MEGTIWDSMEGGALRRWDEGLAELAPPFDSANPSETVRDRAGALGPSWTGVDTRDACTQAGRQCATRSPVSGGRDQKSRIQRAFAVAACR
jgi:hypothetical protein